MSPENFKDATLVILGHGTTLNDGSALPVMQHAAELRRRGMFAAVREAFWKQEPQIKTVLAEIKTPRVFVAPLMISEGYFASEVIPRELGLDAVVSPTRTSPVQGGAAVRREMKEAAGVAVGRIIGFRRLLSITG